MSSSLSVLCQSAWDIGYIEVDSINTNDVGRDVKIDFKSSLSPPNLPFGPKDDLGDTAQLTIRGDIIQLIERRKIYCDWGLYQEQFLECPSYTNHQVLRIYNSAIKEIRDDSILFRLYLEIYNTKRSKIVNGPKRSTEDVWVEKAMLDGVLIETKHDGQ